MTIRGSAPLLSVVPEVRRFGFGLFRRVGCMNGSDHAHRMDGMACAVTSHLNIVMGFSTSFHDASMNRAATMPSMAQWSKLTVAAMAVATCFIGPGVEYAGKLGSTTISYQLKYFQGVDGI